MGFIVETPPRLKHQCKLPKEYFIDENKLAQSSYAHLTIWQCDECEKYWVYKEYRWDLISEKKVMKLKSKWENK